MYVDYLTKSKIKMQLILHSGVIITCIHEFVGIIKNRYI